MMTDPRRDDPHDAETVDSAADAGRDDRNAGDAARGGNGDDAPTVDAAPGRAAAADEAPTVDGAPAGTNNSADGDATVDHPPPRSASAAAPPGFRTVDKADDKDGHPADEAPTIDSDARAARGDREPAMPKAVGHYRITRLIGAGGMGAVYEAEQENPRRTVALKLMKTGIASRAALRRFEYESHLLGRLRHPGIAQVYEAGVHDDGTGAVPYFAMEYVPDAKTLTDYANQQNLNTRQRLELFIKVCDAVHHGHQKGIIHRDLKPDNILVDATGQPKIIDFGVARTTDSDIQAATVQTEVGQLVGTVPYMSPEQIEADPADIDTRSDVYGLGVVLYRLLTGKLPYDLSNTPVYEATRIIKEQQPLRLSTVNHSLKGDVETIVLHALEKDRERRYQSANALLLDIERYLNNEPIAARPPSVLYVWSRFAKRNKLLVGAAAAVFLVLVAGVIGTSTGMVRAQRNYQLAVEEIENQKKTSSYFFGKLGQTVDPRRDEVDIEGKAADAKVVDFMELAVRDAEEELGDFPKVHAAVLSAMAYGYKSLTDFEVAEQQYRKALAIQRQIYDPPSEELASTLRELGSVLWWTGRYEEAEPLFRESMQMYGQLADGGDSEELARSMDYLAACLSRMERYDEAEALYRDALAMRQRTDTPVMVARSMNNLAMCLRDQGNYAEAATTIGEAVNIVREHRGERHIDVANGLTNRASCLIEIAEQRHRAGDAAGEVQALEEARTELREALDIKREELRADHTSIATTQYHLADVLSRMAEHSDRASLAEAEGLIRAAIELQRNGLGLTHRRTVDSLVLLRSILERADGDTAEVNALLGEAERELIDTFQTQRREHGLRDDRTVSTLRSLIYFYDTIGAGEPARDYHAMLREATDQAESSAGR